MEFRKGANTPTCDALLSDTTGCRKRRKRQVRWLAVACLGMLFGSLTLRTNADATGRPCGPAAVYIFDANNSPVLSLSASIFEGGVFTDAGFVGAIDTNFNIVDTNDNIIGYVNYPVPD